MSKNKRHVNGVITVNWSPSNVQTAFTEWMRQVIWGKLK